MCYYRYFKELYKFLSESIEDEIDLSFVGVFFIITLKYNIFSFDAL